MNGIGVGTAVGLGTMIALGIVSGGGAAIEYIVTFAFYGGFAGAIFEVYRFAFQNLGPSRR